MSEFEEANRAQGGETVTSGAKKPYQKPAFRHERVFETMALSCGKVQTTQGQCHANRKNS
jgi:hypothetical protein